MEKRKRGRPSKENRNEIKDKPIYLTVSSNDEIAHGGRDNLLTALKTAIFMPNEMQKLITKAQNEASDRCEKEALKST